MSIKIEEAKEILERWYGGGYAPQIDDLNPAMNLGIEALKAYIKAQDAGWYPPGYKLPGETRD